MIEPKEQAAEAIERFKEYVEETARKNGVRLNLAPESHIPYPSTGDLVNGYMIEFPERQLAVAVGKPIDLWLPVLAHESSHMDQCIEGSPCWSDSYVPGTTMETIDIVELWNERKIELSESQRDDYTARSRNVELDCERRTVEKIRTFNLPIDTTEYIKKANSYIFFYTAMKETRSWYLPGKEPYNTQEVWSLCPEEFLAEEEYERVPTDLMQAYWNLFQ
jgi:hypothetical protein